MKGNIYVTFSAKNRTKKPRPPKEGTVIQMTEK
jgi:hypothetical protein